MTLPFRQERFLSNIAPLAPIHGEAAKMRAAILAE